MRLQNYILEVPDFPQPGVRFKDLTPLLQTPKVFGYVICEMAKFVKQQQANVIVVPEARGFLFGAPVAYESQTKLVLIRKKGKLPQKTYQKTYDLEYGQETLEIQKNDLKPGDRVVIIDDILATGGTLKVMMELATISGAQVVGLSVVADLQTLHPQNLFGKLPFQSLVDY